MRAFAASILGLFCTAFPADAEITPEALSRFELGVREIAVLTDGKPPAEWPSMRDNKLFAAAIRMTTDAQALFGTRALNADDGRAMVRVSALMQQLTGRYASALENLARAGNRSAVAAQAEVAAIVMAFSMKCGAANADVLGDLYLKNPTNLPPQRLASVRSLLRENASDTILSGVEFATNKNVAAAQRRDVLTALADSIERMAVNLPQARRSELAGTMSAAADKTDRESRAILTRAIQTMNGAACNQVCAGG